MNPRQPFTDEHSESVVRALRGGAKTAADLVELLGISQPTVSRTIHGLANQVTAFRVRGKRAPQYALLRQLPLGLNARQTISRFKSNGQIDHFAEVEFLVGGSTLERTGTLTRLYEGLPPYMLFASPSGFLGRQLAQEAAKTQPFPGSLRDWGDDHRVAYLFTMGVNLPGNLVFGLSALQKELDLHRVAPTPAAEKLQRYEEMASALKGAAYGSSAGGEQPKFLWAAEDAGHVIVKFARRGSRMADLLPLEHLALRSLSEIGVPASRTQLICSGDFVFLEVHRFDRIGRYGRVGLLSAGAVDDEYFGARDSWPAFADRCVKQKFLTAADAHTVDIVAAFSELIGNTDRHFENISLLIGDDGEFLGIAPAYDILPMRYASFGGGVDPDLVVIEPKVGAIGAKPNVWSKALEGAKLFWGAVMQEQLPAPVSDEMRSLASVNLKAAQLFAAPLIPGS